MNIQGPLIQATFIERPNRFITIVEIKGIKHRSYLPDPGRLKELLFPGVQILLQSSDNSKRKTRFTTVMVYNSNQLISLVTTLPNKFVMYSLKRNELPMFINHNFIRSEIKVGNHRFDFLLQHKKNRYYLEVKSVTHVRKGVAKFPDAITARGKKHVEALTALVKQGKEAGILFVCQRSDANIFSPMWDVDPKFSKALLIAYKAGVKIWCITLNVDMTEITMNREIPVNLEHY